MLLDVRSFVSLQKKKRAVTDFCFCFCVGWEMADGRHCVPLSAGLILLREKQSVPWSTRTCLLAHKCKQFTVLGNQTFRVKYTPASWLEIRPLLKLKVSFVGFLEVWILLGLSTLLCSSQWHRKKVLFFYSLRVCVWELWNELTKGRLTGRKATDFIWNLFVLCDTKYIIDPKEIDGPGVLYYRKAGLGAGPSARNWGIK